MSTKQIFKNIDYTNTSAYLTIKEYEKLTGQKFNPEDSYQRLRHGGVFPNQEWKQLELIIDFDLRAQPSMEPIKTEISHMSRFKVFGYNKGKLSSKEVMTATGEYRGVDYRGKEISATFFLGWYKKPKTKWVPDDLNNPDARDRYGNKLGSVKTSGEIEYIYTIDVPNDVKQRRELIDSIIEKCPGSFKENILFVYRDHKPSTVGPMGPAPRSTVYSYDQFYKCDINELNRLLYQRYGPDGRQPWFNQEDGKWHDAQTGNIIDQTKGLYR